MITYALIDLALQHHQWILAVLLTPLALVAWALVANL